MSTLFGKKKKIPKRKRSEEEDGPLDLVGEKEGQKSLTIEHHAPAPSTTASTATTNNKTIRSFDDLGLAEPLVATCRKLGFRQPTPVQRQLIPFLLHNRQEHVLALASTGSGKTAAFVLPILHHLASDPYGVYAVILTPTRELAKQIHQQCLALGSAYDVTSQLVVGGLDAVQQSCALQHQHPHILVATPGRLAALLRGPPPRPRLQHCRYVVLDEADRLLASSNNCGFERDVAELLLHTSSNTNNNNHGTGTAYSRKTPCQTLLFSATLTASLTAMEELAGGGGRLPLRKFIVRQDGEEDDEKESNDKKKQAKRKAKKEQLKSKDDYNAETSNTECHAVGISNAPCEGDDISDDDSDDSESSSDDNDRITVGPKIPNGLQQEYIFLPSKVRDAYLLATVRTLMAHGGRSAQDEQSLQQRQQRKQQQPKHRQRERGKNTTNTAGSESTTGDTGTAKSAIIFVSTCERAALVSGILEHVGVANVALHSLLSQPRRLAALAKFQSEQVRVLVATDGTNVTYCIVLVIERECEKEFARSPPSHTHTFT